jgi:hypothetical protein
VPPRQPHRRFSLVLKAALLAAALASCDDKPAIDLPVQEQVRDLAALSALAAKPEPGTTTTGPAVAAGQNPAGDAGDLGNGRETRGETDANLAGAHPSLFVRSSRCGECHEKIHLDWSQSAHASASRSPAYHKGVLAAGEALQGFCQSCHLPSLAYGQTDEVPGRPSEGVACDGCHTISSVAIAKTQAVIKFDPGSGKKYGPILGATGHYFHDMAYSALHTKSEVCAGCHYLPTVKLGDKVLNIPVVSDYNDWKLYGKGQSCQDCHMPSRGTEPVAKGAKARPNVPGHLFAGATTLGKQIHFEISQKGKPGTVAVEIQHSAGHALPSGFVDRRLIVRAEFFGQNGAKLASIDHSYGIKLVNAAGQPAPFFQAARIAEDHRMVPGRPYLESFPIPNAPVGADPTAGGPVRVTLSLLAAATAPELSQVYGEPELTVLRSTSLTLPVHPGGR